MPSHRILVLDDESGVRFGLRRFLGAKGFDVVEAASCAQAEQLFRDRRPDVALLDYSLPDGNALELMPRLKAVHPDVPLVILTAHGTIDLAVRAVKEGAEHFLTKPVELAALLVILERLLEARRRERRQLAGKSREARKRPDPFASTSPSLQRLAEEALRMAASDSPVLILGETGVGKSVLAAWLHEKSARASEAFVDLNCATLSRELLETELFGHEKGAFTGAASTKVGLLEVAHRGTLFLDEIGDVDITVQPKLLTVLEEGRFRRVGDVRDREVDVRLVAATHQDLPALVRDKRFRSDLYFRISALPLTIPPLRERVSDLPGLARGLLEGIAGELGRGKIAIAPAAELSLLAYPWPGNVRELRNVLERAAILSRDGVLQPSDLRFESALVGERPRTGLTLEEVERQHIERVLQEERGHVERAAEKLGVPRSSLYHRIKRLGLVVPRD